MKTASPATGRRYGFGALWLGQSLSLIGTQIGTLALSLMAVIELNASADQLGVIKALQYLPFLLFALPLGPLVDRKDRRRLMLVADVARMLLVAVVPLLHFLGVLTLWWLYALPFVIGVFQVLFDSAYMAYVPQLVGREQLPRANRNLQASQSAADLGGPGLGGLVVGALGAPLALVLDALSFALSAVTLAAIGPLRSRSRSRQGSEAEPEPESVPEPDTAPSPKPRGALATWWQEVREGLVFVFGQAELRALALETAVFNACEQGILVLYTVYAVRELDFSPLLLGLSLAAGGVGALLGTFLSELADARLGLGPTIVLGSVVGGGSFLLIPLADGSQTMVFALVCSGLGLAGFATGVSNVLQVSLRQMLTPDALTGRMTASLRFVAYGMVPVGSLLGGVVGSAIGLRPALWVLTVLLLLGPLVIICSPLPRRRTLPEERPTS
ncbi:MULTISPECIES: MFS transporter [unclassified Streptomyces]|uniref:MFS transporter n=1 Tax=unclassified Streptomyces TaxID=2593676 RepID=UPI0035D943E2